jgi:hypothetical protein
LIEPVSFPSTRVTREVQVYDPLVEGLEIDAMINMGRMMLDRARAGVPNLLVDVGISKVIEDVLLTNSKGGEAAYKKTVMAGSIHGNLIRDTEMIDISDGRVTCELLPSYDDVVDELIERFQQASRTAAVATREMPVLFTPKGFVGTMLGPLESALNGKMVLQGASALGDKLGLQVFDPRLTIVDDGMVDFAPHSSVCDDEGVPTRRTTMIDKGVLNSFYYDLKTASLAGKESTGNGFRSLYSPPGPSPTSVIFSTGEATMDEIISGIKEGLLVDQVMGAWAGNALAGEPLPREELLRLAGELEGHPDNVAAALYGGLTVCWACDPEPECVALQPGRGLAAVAVVSEAPLPTAASRKLLPAEVPHADAAFNVARAGALVAGMLLGEPALLAAGLEDRLHEPYRASAVTDLAEVKAALIEAGADGAALSGAGPTVIGLVTAEDDEAARARAMRVAEAAAERLSTTAGRRAPVALGIDRSGAVLL